MKRMNIESRIIISESIFCVSNSNMAYNNMQILADRITEFIRSGSEIEKQYRSFKSTINRSFRDDICLLHPWKKDSNPIARVTLPEYQSYIIWICRETCFSYQSLYKRIHEIFFIFRFFSFLLNVIDYPLINIEQRFIHVFCISTIQSEQSNDMSISMANRRTIWSLWSKVSSSFSPTFDALLTCFESFERSS